MHVIVIGAGVLGISTAYFLQKRGAEVTLLDAASSPAEGASYGNGGYLQSTFPDPWNAPGTLQLFWRAWSNYLSGRADRSAFSIHTRTLPGLLRWGASFLSHSTTDGFFASLNKNYELAQYSQQAFNEINTSDSLSYDQGKSGSLIIFRDPASLEGYVSLVTRGPGSNASRILDRDALIAREPSLAAIDDQLQGAVHYPLDHAGNSRNYCQSLLALMQGRGLKCYFENQVLEIRHAGNSVNLTTNASELTSDAVVIAAGAYSNQLTAPLGLRMNITPAKGYSISIPITNWRNRPKHVIADMSIHAGINPLGDILRVAGTAEFCGFKTGMRTARTEYLMSLATQVFPDLEGKIDMEKIDPWSGFRSLSSDGLPYIGETGVPSVYVNCGHGGLGWTQAAGSGKALAMLMVGETSELDLSAYSPARHN